MPIGKVSFNLNNGTPFSRELLKRTAEFMSKPTIGYKIVVPDDLRWWYFLEFGTAGRQDADAPFKTEHTGTYPIDPIHGKGLVFENARVPNMPDGSRFTVHVDHPGIRPRLIYRGVRSEILEYAKASMATSLAGGVNLESLNVALQLDIMPYALARMGARLEEQAPGVKTRGNNPFK